MKFGICTSVEQAAVSKAAGADFVEENVQSFFQGQVADQQWTGRARMNGAALTVPAANSLVPGSLKITGPEARRDALGGYMSTVVRRAAATGTRMLVFGSGGARNVPEGLDRNRARDQIIDFLKTCAAVGADHGVTFVVEPLNRKECNIINSVAEAMEYVRAVNHPNVQCLVDSYHLWLEDEPVENVRVAMPWIKHVHVADKVGRVPPGESGQADYRPLFAVLKSGGYQGLVSIEASKFNDIAGVGPRVIEFLRRQWGEA
jgi:sugar phosphate isomerase/epimerase